MPPKTKPVASKKPAKKPAKRPAKKPKPRAPITRNTNSVRVHIINGGDPAPPPYTGPDRGSFVFNPVFDMDSQKAQMLPPMNSSVALAASPVNRVTEMQTQAGDGLFDRFVASANPSMGTGTGLGAPSPFSRMEVGESSQQAYDNMSRKKLIHITLNLGKERKKVNKANKLQLAKDVKEAMRKR